MRCPVLRVQRRRESPASSDRRVSFPMHWRTFVCPHSYFQKPSFSCKKSIFCVPMLPTNHLLFPKNVHFHAGKSIFFVSNALAHFCLSPLVPSKTFIFQQENQYFAFPCFQPSIFCFQKNPPPRLARTAFLRFGRRPPPLLTFPQIHLHSTHFPTDTSCTSVVITH